MSKSRRNRRKGGRTTPKGTQNPQAPNKPAATTFFGSIYQKSGAIGILLTVAEFAAREDDPEGPDRASTGSAFVQLMQDDQSKLAANALVAISEVWPDHEVRDAAQAAVAGRRHQLAGVLRMLDAVAVECAWRLTDEYEDCDVHFFELRAGGRLLFTLAAQTHEFRRSWVHLELLNVTAKEATTHYLPSDEPGKPRPITRQLSAQELRIKLWGLGSRRNVEFENAASATILSWLARMQAVDVEFPELPNFDPVEIDDDDDHGEDEAVDALAELDAFLTSESGRPWRTASYDVLVDHLGDYEWGHRAMKWSPCRVEDFLLFQEPGLDGAAQALPALLRQWVRHCAKVMGQRKPLLQAVLDEIDRCEPRFFAERGHVDAA